jgi:hypothetical protein
MLISFLLLLQEGAVLCSPTTSSPHFLESFSTSSSSSPLFVRDDLHPPSSWRRELTSPPLSQSLPRGLINQTSEEAEYLGFHKCVDAFEAYGAAYLITTEHLLQQNTNYSLDWVNCEMASFIMVRPPSFPPSLHTHSWNSDFPSSLLLSSKSGTVA